MTWTRRNQTAPPLGNRHSRCAFLFVLLNESRGEGEGPIWASASRQGTTRRVFSACRPPQHASSLISLTPAAVYARSTTRARSVRSQGLRAHEPFWKAAYLRRRARAALLHPDVGACGQAGARVHGHLSPLRNTMISQARCAFLGPWAGVSAAADAGGWVRLRSWPNMLSSCERHMSDSSFSVLIILSMSSEIYFGPVQCQNGVDHVVTRRIRMPRMPYH